MHHLFTHVSFESKILFKVQYGSRERYMGDRRGVGPRAWVCKSVGMCLRVWGSAGAGLNESGMFASLTKESSVAGQTAVNIL